MQTPPGALTLRDMVRGTVYPFVPGRQALVGRRPGPGGAHILVEDPTVSGIHLEIHCVGGALKLIDRSSQGTYVNGRRLVGEALARHGDRIALGGGYPFVVIDPAAPALAADASRPPADASRPPADAPTNPPQNRQPAPQVIGDRYRVVRELAQGGMGIVYEAIDDRPADPREPRRAIKVLKRGKASPEQEERFRREASVAQKLGDHPGIVPVWDVGALPTGELYYVMELVEGPSLWDKLQQGLTREEAVKLVADVARAVAHAHARDVIHRDLKPQNVIVTPDGRARLTDFGIAKALDDSQGLTVTGAVMGTPRFMPPEQAEDSKRVDARSDVFGLGAILFTCLLRRPPLDLTGLGTREALEQIVECKVPPPASLDAKIDPALDSIVRRSMARRPEHRQQTAAALADELEAWLKGDRTARPVVGEAEDEDEDRSGGPGKALLLVLVVGLLLAAAIVVVAFAS